MSRYQRALTICNGGPTSSIDTRTRPDNIVFHSSLNVVLQIYKERNFGRVLGSWIALYLL